MTAEVQVAPTGRAILVVDHRADRAAMIRTLLEREGHRVLTAEGGAAALALLGAESLQVLLIEYSLPTGAEELIGRVRDRDALVQIVLRTGPGREKLTRETGRRLAVQGYHDESDGQDRLLLCVDVALRAYEQLAQLRIAERLKTELLASVSHEFRTPLNVIVGYIDLVREGTFGACPPDVLPVFEKIRLNAGYLLELVEEFLDLAKVESGATSVRPEAVALAPFLHELGEWFALLVRARPIQFVTDVPSDLPAVVAEPAKLRVVIQNLLSNAAKFTHEGAIRLSAAAHPGGRVAIRVGDTGPGIAPEHHEAIFELFHQLRPHDTQTKGIGLGLALARRFTRMMGGDITVDSALGAGTTFTVVLPARASPIAAGGDAAA
jgi:signal transduction histidine kinase